MRVQASNLRKVEFTRDKKIFRKADEKMTPEEAKKELERVMESGDTKELQNFIERSWGNFELMTAIMDVLIPVATERKAGD